MVVRKKSYFASIILFYIVFLFNPIFSYAWNNVGHRVIATIAYSQLSPYEKRELQTWIKPLRYYYPFFQDIQALATWPDWIKGQGVKAFNTWHYVNRPYGLNNYKIQTHYHSDSSNIIWAIGQSEIVLVSKKSNPVMRWEFLAFLIHCVGDIHQPFHTISAYSVVHPQGDEGGNDFMVLDREYGKQSLHFLWDNGLGLFNHGGKKSLVKGSELANDFMKRFPPSYFGKKISILDPEAWAKESYGLAVEVGYGTQEGKPLSKDYIIRGQSLIMEQVTLSGYRLARILKAVIREHNSEKVYSRVMHLNG